MDEKRRGVPTMIGAVSLLVIFAVLTLTVFAVLTLSTARAEARLREQSAAAVTDYYAADCRAEEILARLRAGELPAGVREENGAYEYACPISDTLTLVVEVTVEGADYTVHRWQAVPAADWQADDSLPVWSGGG